MVVDNRSGGGGTIGAETVVRANPDGYTMLLVGSAYAANAAFYKLPYDPVSDVAPVSLIGETGFVVTLHPSIPVTSIKELIAYDKGNPGKLNFGSGGTGSATHLTAELFNQMAGTRMTHVPYKGAGLALNDLLGGQIQLIISGMPQMIPQIKAKRVRGIAVTTAKRNRAVPDIPTVAETVPGYEAVSWQAVVGPKAAPKDILARWNREIDRILQLPDVKERMAGEGMEPAGGSPERFREVLDRDVAKWREGGQGRQHQAGKLTFSASRSEESLGCARPLRVALCRPAPAALWRVDFFSATGGYPEIGAPNSSGKVRP